MHRLSILACITEGNIKAIVLLIESQLLGTYGELIIGQSPADFAAFKAKSAGAAHQCALFVETNMAHDVIKDMCDDFAKPTTDRRVKFIYSMSAGVDAYNVQSLEKQLEGIPFYNAQGCYDNILAEHVVFSAGYFNRQLWRFLKNKHDKNYEKYNIKEIRGQKAVVIGYGSIGQATGRLCALSGMQVTGIRRTVDPADPSATVMVDAHGVTVRGEARLDAALAEADFVIGVLPGTAATAHYFNRDIFGKMKKDAIFMNIGRGATQNETDLLEAITTGTIAGAAVDVFEVEPLPQSSPLWELPDDKLLLTPHCADWTAELIPDSVRRFMGIYEKTITGQAVNEHTVDVKKGY